jgi:hypothetical protein
VCFGRRRSGPGRGFSTVCPYQYVAKLDPTGKLLWDTYVTGTYGAIGAGIPVDSAGNAIAEAPTKVSGFRKRIKATGEQLTQPARWRPILSAAFQQFLRGKLLGCAGRLADATG